MFRLHAAFDIDFFPLANQTSRSFYSDTFIPEYSLWLSSRFNKPTLIVLRTFKEELHLAPSPSTSSIVVTNVRKASVQRREKLLYATFVSHRTPHVTSVIEGLKPFSPCVCYYTRMDIFDFALVPENVPPEHSPNFVISRVRMGAESEKNERRNFRDSGPPGCDIRHPLYLGSALISCG